MPQITNNTAANVPEGHRERSKAPKPYDIARLRELADALKIIGTQYHVLEGVLLSGRSRELELFVEVKREAASLRDRILDHLDGIGVEV